MKIFFALPVNLLHFHSCAPLPKGAIIVDNSPRRAVGISREICERLFLMRLTKMRRQCSDYFLDVLRMPLLECGGPTLSPGVVRPWRFVRAPICATASLVRELHQRSNQLHPKFVRGEASAASISLRYRCSPRVASISRSCLTSVLTCSTTSIFTIRTKSLCPDSTIAA